MQTLTAWAQRHHILPAALADLVQLLGATVPPTPPISGLKSEAAVQQARRLVAARRGALLWRNNSGACQDVTGRQIRYGLANESAKVNKIFKSSDLIGITPVVCGCGQRYGVFTAEECKHAGWTYRERSCTCRPGKPQCDACHESAQLNFLKRVVSLGGIGRFISDPDIL